MADDDKELVRRDAEFIERYPFLTGYLSFFAEADDQSDKEIAEAILEDLRNVSPGSYAKNVRRLVADARALMNSLGAEWALLASHANRRMEGSKEAAGWLRDILDVWEEAIDATDGRSAP